MVVVVVCGDGVAVCQWTWWWTSRKVLIILACLFDTVIMTFVICCSGLPFALERGFGGEDHVFKTSMFLPAEGRLLDDEYLSLGVRIEDFGLPEGFTEEDDGVSLKVTAKALGFDSRSVLVDVDFLRHNKTCFFLPVSRSDTGPASLGNGVVTLSFRLEDRGSRLRTFKDLYLRVCSSRRPPRQARKVPRVFQLARLS